MAKPAGSPGNGPKKDDANTGTLTLRVTHDQNSDGLPNQGDGIVFDVVADEWIQVTVTASQGDTPVFSGAYLSVNLAQPCVLQSQAWMDSPGAARGHAELIAHKGTHGDTQIIGSLDFDIGA